MFWRKPKEVPVEVEKLEPEQHLEYDEMTFDVGVTTVLVIFDDNREVHTKIYGEVDQYVDYPSYGRKTYRVNTPSIWTSEEKYRHWLQHTKPDEFVKVLDDPMTPEIAWCGRIIHLEKVETQKHEIKYQVARIVEGSK